MKVGNRPGGEWGGMLPALEGLQPTAAHRRHQSEHLQNLREQTLVSAQAWPSDAVMNAHAYAEEQHSHCCSREAISPISAPRADVLDGNLPQSKRLRSFEDVPSESDLCAWRDEDANLLLDDILDLVELDGDPETEMMDANSSHGQLPPNGRMNAPESAPCVLDCPAEVPMSHDESDAEVEEDKSNILELFSSPPPSVVARARSMSRAYAPRATTYAPLLRCARIGFFDDYEHRPVPDHTLVTGSSSLKGFAGSEQSFGPATTECVSHPAEDFEENCMDSPYETPCTAKVCQALSRGTRQLLEQLSLSPEDGLLFTRPGVGYHHSCVCGDRSMQMALAQRKHCKFSNVTLNGAIAACTLTEGDKGCQTVEFQNTKLDQWPLPPPSLLVSCDGQALPVSPSALFWWEKAALQPIAHRKQLSYVVLCSEEVSDVSVTRFCQELSVMYRTCRLGSLDAFNGKWLHRYRVSGALDETQGMRAVAGDLRQCLSQQPRRCNQRTVVFLVHGLHQNAGFHSLAKMLCVVSPLLRPMQGRPVPVLQPLALAQLRETHSLQFRLKQIAFSIYTKSRAAPLSSHSVMGEYSRISYSSSSRVSSADHEPLFVVPPVTSHVTPSADAAPTCAGAARLHCSYVIAGVETTQHACVCWTDDSGYALEVACLPCGGMPLEECVQLVWEHGSRLRELQMSESGTLRVAVLKFGIVTQAEIEAWEAIFSDGEQHDGLGTTGALSSGSVWQRRVPLPVTQLTSAPRRGPELDDQASISVLSLRSFRAAPSWVELSARPSAEAKLPRATRLTSGMLPQLVLRTTASSPSHTACLLQTDLALELHVCLHLTHSARLGHGGETVRPNTNGSSSEQASDGGNFLGCLCTELHRLSWLTATPPSTLSSSFEQRWSKLPVHCAIVERLAEFVEWMIDEGVSGDRSSEDEEP